MFRIFNPEHDIVLALDAGAGFTPPKAARRLRQDLCHLPTLWGSDEKISVWGWDAAVVAELLKKGVPREKMPSDNQLMAIRRLSNRSLAVEMLSLLRTVDGTIGISAVCCSYDAVQHFASEHGATILKAPWSSSGRGVKLFTPSNQRWIDNVIAQQGTIIAESRCDRVMDFALEYQSTPDGRVEYIGLSLFSTVNGAYKGNLLMPEEKKRQQLCQYIPEATLLSVSAILKAELAQRLRGVYTGPLGVDMMVCRSDHAYLLNPCVEINLRRTMGHVALALTAQGYRGTMSVLYNKEKDKYELSIAPSSSS